MHLVMVREVVGQHPWLAANIAHAFNEAKRLGYERVRIESGSSRMVYDWEEEQSILGPDPWAYGLDEQNKANLQTLMRYTHEQGLIEKEPDIAELVIDVSREGLHGTTGF